jgi:esterase/lipase superfamily enzyme
MLSFVLDLRSAPVGGAVVPARLTSGTPTPDMLQQCTDVAFLVHGFNVDRSDGAEELTAFGGRLTALGDAGAAVAVLWPGDSTIGPLSYPFETNKADDSAVELATFIGDQLPHQPRISFIGHSLGCRVVMETVRQLWIKNIPVAQVCLMAAAIDNDSLGIGVEYLHAAQYTARTGVLYSPSDTVLKDAYPIGNLVSAFLHGASTTDAALGFSGPVSVGQNATLPPQVAAVGIPARNGVNHGDYLPNASQVFNARQASAARFANSMLTGTTPLAYV